MYVGAEETAKPSGLAAFGNWLVSAGQAYFEYDVQKSKLEAAQVLQAQGMTAAQAQAAVSTGVLPAAPGLTLANPLVVGGIALLAGIVLYKFVFVK